MPSRRPSVARDDGRTSFRKGDESMPYAASFVLYVTLKCNLSCAHCIQGPAREDESMPFHDYRQGLIEAAEAGHDGVWISGGEPFLSPDRLLQSVETCAGLGLRVSVQTNAQWATSQARALAMLRELKALGMQQLCISTDKFHAAFVPVERVVMLAECARELSIPVNTGASGRLDDPVSRRLSAALRRKRIPLARQTLLRFGAACALPLHEFHWRQRMVRGGCTNAMRLQLFPDGRVYACCGPAQHFPKGSPLYLGDQRRESVAGILERAAVDPILAILMLAGPGGVYRAAAPSDRRQVQLPRPYSHRCEACYHVLSVPGLVPDLRECILSDSDWRLRLLGEKWLSCRVINRTVGNKPHAEWMRMREEDAVLSRGHTIQAWGTAGARQ